MLQYIITIPVFFIVIINVFCIFSLKTIWRQHTKDGRNNYADKYKKTNIEDKRRNHRTNSKDGDQYKLTIRIMIRTQLQYLFPYYNEMLIRWFL